MATKRYVSKTGVKYTFLVEANGKVKSISFKGNEKDCIVKDPATQKAVEESDYFKNGLIGVAKGTTAGGFDEEVQGLAGGESTPDKLKVNRANSKGKGEQEAEGSQSSSDGEGQGKGGESTGAGFEPAEYLEVTDWQDAREVLLGEPYNLAPQAVAKKPEAIQKKAEELGASFPNIK